MKREELGSAAARVKRAESLVSEIESLVNRRKLVTNANTFAVQAWGEHHTKLAFGAAPNLDSIGFSENVRTELVRKLVKQIRDEVAGDLTDKIRCLEGELDAL